jgi:hypothetical protein
LSDWKGIWQEEADANFESLKRFERLKTHALLNP